MPVATLSDEAIGVAKAALRAVDQSIETLEKHRHNLRKVLAKLEGQKPCYYDGIVGCTHKQPSGREVTDG